MSTELQSDAQQAISVEVSGNLEPKWQEREEELLKKIKELELIQTQDKTKITTLENETKALQEEKTNLLSTNQKLEKDIDARKNQTVTESIEVQKIKQESEELLLKAKGIIFEKTKVCQNQELQIEALTQQVASLKQVVSLTKELLEIRNLEVNQLEDKINTMDMKIKVEKEKQDLMSKKMDRLMEMNNNVKREYETQLVLFNALRERYNERELARDVIDEAPPAANNL